MVLPITKAKRKKVAAKRAAADVLTPEDVAAARHWPQSGLRGHPARRHPRASLRPPLAGAARRVRATARRNFNRHLKRRGRREWLSRRPLLRNPSIQDRKRIMYMPPDPLEIHPQDLSAAAVATPVVAPSSNARPTGRATPSAAAGASNSTTEQVCFVCERPMRQKGLARRQFCCKRANRRFTANPEQFWSVWNPPGRGVADAGRKALRSAHSTGLKSGAKPGRAWRLVAGPGADLHPINLVIPLDPETAARNRRANAATGPRPL